MKCAKGYEIKVLKSGAGWYIGTLDEDGFPNCRISIDYYADKDSAENALKNRTFRFRFCAENDWCANSTGHGGCFVKGGC